MTAQEKLIQKILDSIDSSVNAFNESIPAIQQTINDDLQSLIKELEVNGKYLKNTVPNLRLLGNFRSKVEAVILNDDYVEKVKAFKNSFTTIAGLQHDYFTSLESKFKPFELLDAIKKDSVSAAVNSLTEAGISVNVTDGIIEVLRTNITSGGKYADMLESMRNFIMGNENTRGSLERYTSQITTDSLNQFSAVYNNTISSDLGFKWRMYVGSNIKTSRNFCIKLTAKKFYHVDELPEILKGHIDGERVRVNPKTGLWYGAYEDTTVANFADRRGGYKCGHQDFGVSEAVIPKMIRIQFYTENNIPFDQNGFAKKVA